MRNSRIFPGRERLFPPRSFYREDYYIAESVIAGSAQRKGEGNSWLLYHKNGVLLNLTSRLTESILEKIIFRRAPFHGRGVKRCLIYRVSNSITSHLPLAEDQGYSSAPSANLARTGLRWMYSSVLPELLGKSRKNLGCQSFFIPMLLTRAVLYEFIIFEIEPGAGTFKRKWQWSGIITKANRKKGYND